MFSSKRNRDKPTLKRYHINRKAEVQRALKFQKCNWEWDIGCAERVWKQSTALAKWNLKTEFWNIKKRRSHKLLR